MRKCTPILLIGVCAALSCALLARSILPPEGSDPPSTPGPTPSWPIDIQEPPTAEEDLPVTKISITVAGQSFTATLADTEAARTWAERLPMTVTMSELNGNEKYYYMDTSLPTASQRPGTIQSGDLMLYGNDCLVLFYKTFSSSYSYTPLGHIDDPAGLATAVGSGSVTVTFAVT